MAVRSKVAARPHSTDENRLASVVHLAALGAAPGSEKEDLADAVRIGLSARPKTLPSRFFYDAAGSELFERICRLPEYYLTRTEDAILRQYAGDMVDLGGPSEPPTLIELGSGSADKTRHLIAAALARYGSLQYVPVDVSATAVRDSARALVKEFPGLRVSGFVTDYHETLEDVAARFPGTKIYAFLGSSLGNYEADLAAKLLGRVAGVMGPRDRFLLGTDLAKSAAVLEPAYDDAQGVTARFNRNVLVRINRVLGGDFDPDRFAHRAVYRADLGRVEMHLRSLGAQSVRVPGCGSFGFEDGETIHTENSHKYTHDSLEALAARGGFAEDAAWTDGRVWFRVQRWRAERGE